MSFNETLHNLLQKFKKGPLISEGNEPNLPNGGHTGYVPVVNPKQQQPQQQPQQTSYDPSFFQNTGFQQNYVNQGAFQQGYQPQQEWQPPVSFGTQQGYNPVGQGGMAWQQIASTNSNMQAQGFMQPNVPQQAPQRSFMQQPQTATASQQSYATDGNVTYAFGQQFRGQNGVAYNHVERLAQPLSVTGCFRLIEFMRNGESIIVNLELVNDENERTRCLDMLCGAAFTMQCTFNRIAEQTIYLISPATVQVIPYESIRQLSEEDQQNRWGAEEASIRTEPRWSGHRNNRHSYAQVQ